MRYEIKQEDFDVECSRCGWKGKDSEMIIVFYERSLSPPGNISVCPKCYRGENKKGIAQS